MAGHSKIADILMRAGVIDDLQLRSAVAKQNQWGGRLTRVLLDLRLGDEEKITEALARGLGVPRAQLGHKDPAALARLDVAFAEKHGVFPVELTEQGKTLVLAMADPSDLGTLDEAARRSRARVVVNLASESELANAIARHYRNEAPVRRPGGGATPEEEFVITDMRTRDSGGKRTAEPPPPAATQAAGGATFSPELMARLEVVRSNQSKSAIIFRAITELLIEKGLMGRRDLQEKVEE